MNVVVVESPTKAKTINKYLGSDFTVLPSYGHVRDLPEKDGSVLPDDDFHMIYEVQEDKKKRIDEIARAVRGADKLVLATDPDREGEAISWHVLSALQDKKAIKKNLPIERVLFYEVTKPAVLDAMKAPRQLDHHLIDAYQARRALDYLVGFTLSPVLWRKLQGARSAGRVQSVALRLVCEREAEIEAFIAREYWTVTVGCRTAGGEPFTARLAKLGGKRLDRFDLPDEASAKTAVQAIEAACFQVGSVEKKQVSRNPAPPFSTSTLQQEASRKLGFSADRTMRTAQRLFEGVNLNGEQVGLITYMRTDSVALSNDAISQCRRWIGNRFSERHLPEKPRVFKTKTKNAQEAHEAIRPTDVFREPKEISQFLDDDGRRLYDLIWKRTVACQMAAALLDRVTAEIDAVDGSVGLRATGQTVTFPGFLELYQEGRDDPSADDEDDESRLLPPMAKGEPVTREKVTPAQHFTEPPPRFTEASLVKRMEELGIGRPSTYASILSVLQARQYVRLEQKRFVPESRGRIVVAFLTSFFDQYVQPDFTAKLEDQLDDIASGEIDWKAVLRAFWDPFKAKIEDVKERRVADVIDALNDALATRLFPPREDGSDPRICPTCGTGQLSLKIGKFGAFVGCSNYPECRFTRQLDVPANDAGAPESKDRLLGTEPVGGEEVWLKVGRFGPYVQQGAGETAKRSSLPPNLKPDDIDLQTALALLSLPREIGTDPATGKPITAGINRFGPFVQSAGRFVRLGADEDVLTIGMNRAIALLSEPPSRGPRATLAPLKEVGVHPENGQPIQLFAGRFGPYVKCGDINASLPKSVDPESLDLPTAARLIDERAAKGPAPKKPKRGAPARKAAAPAKKTLEKKTAAKKAPVRKTAVKEVVGAAANADAPETKPARRATKRA
ncbi:MAG TPA: type I DNA topoisomerase [Geminicoccus sp.]|jgi:DNA topoisomerase-1|uniref:type I DNA topoisomerase n=1 Tax=Geminicoccus sp. TaxID=2024832 RepID=UPI002E34AD7D|nr:type I DNA topoisomerase [Geminicoccus sp.]HEX2527392.1 type I DNA topoisomerase [Geminicoccus sp.]